MTDIRFENGKFKGYYNGKVVVTSSSKYYCKRKLEEMEETPAPKPSEFGINTRFGFLEQMVDMVADGSMPSCVITGEGGLGKSYTVMNTLESKGYRNITDLSDFQIGERINLAKSYRIVKGFSTAKGLYRTLFESNRMVVVFDDCDSVLKDDVARNLLKGALDSYSKRYISWNADMRDDDLPKTFEFTGRVIFVSNIALNKIDQAIRTRCMVVDLSMTEQQKIERMEVISNSDDFLPEIDMVVKENAIKFLKSMIGSIPNMSLRSLIQVCKIFNRGGDQTMLAKYVLQQGQ